MIEYTVLNTGGSPISTAKLNEMGADNWQLIQVISDVAYFSRPKVDEPKPVKRARKRAVKK